MIRKVLLTGASGFLGKSIAQCLGKSGNTELASVFRGSTNSVANSFCVGDIDGTTDFSAALLGQDVVIHTAARVHVMRDKSSDPISEFRKVNVEGTLNLARQSVLAGINRFVFISSIKVNGELTSGSGIFSEQDIPNAQDPYGRSKHEAEQGLLEISKNSDLEVVIIRPPLIYGPGVKGNFASMIKAIKYRLPLPFGLVDNERSLIALDNLVDLIITCIDHPKAGGQIFLASDGKDVSSLDLVNKIANAFCVTPFVLPMPVPLMRIVAKKIGKGLVADRLFGDLRIDSTKAKELLGWSPIVTMDQQLASMAAYEIQVDSL